MRDQGEPASAGDKTPGEGAPAEHTEEAELFPGAVAELPIDYLLHEPAALAALFLEQQVPGAPERLEHIEEYLMRVPEPRESMPARDYVITYAALISVELGCAGDATTAIRQAERVMERISGLSAADLDDCRLILPWFWLTAATAYAAVGRQREALILWRRIQASDVSYPRFLASGQIAVNLAFIGELDAAVREADAAEQIGTEHGWFFGVHMTAVIIARLLVAAGRLDYPALCAATDQLAEAVVAEPAFIVGSEVFRSLALRLQGRSDDAIDRLQTIFYRSNTSTAPLVWDMLRNARATVLLAQGMPGVVLRELEGRESTSDHVVCLESIRAFALLSLGMGREALDETTTCVRRGNKHCPGTIQQALFARAGALFVLGRRRAAGQAFDRALAAGASAGYEAVTLLPITMLEELLADARRRGVEVPDRLDPIPGKPTNRLDWSYQRIGALSDRERGLLLELRSEGTLESIADRIFLARNTVKAHSRRIYAKLGAQSRTEAVDIAEAVGLFDVPGEYWSSDGMQRAS